MQVLANNTARAEDRHETARPGYARYAWFVLFFNLIIIAVGAVVRATGSGDGCGSHWPLCNGETVPVAPAMKTVIEFTHRAVSGIDGPLVLALLFGAFRLFPKGHPIKKAALATFVLTGVEAWIGAYLVKQRLVAHNATPERALWMAIHLVNTFFLLTALTMTAWWGSGGARLRLRGQGGIGLGLALGFVAMVALGVSGAITALGDTLFPATSHADFIRQAEVGKHFLQQLRLIHAPLAGSVGLYLLLIAGLSGHFRPSPHTRRWAQAVGWLFLAQILVGGLNVWLLAPVWMQVIHLVMADLVWTVMSLLALAALAEGVPQIELRAYAPATTDGRPTWRDYVVLTKPRVISLLLFTTLAAMFIAQDAAHRVTPLLFLAVALGGYMAAGAANAINMVIDRDIDVRMARTAKRPTVTQKIPSRDALMFGLGMAFGSFALLWAAANILAALLSLAGLVFYVVVYTLFLKRRTWHNIVIGGAAGAFPPLVGWAAVTGDLKNWLAWYLFAIVFVWTPAHFWALALLIKDDYAEAGVPMLPVVKGDRMTVAQICLYAGLTVYLTLVPVGQFVMSAAARHVPLWSGAAQTTPLGIGYGVAAVLLNGVLLFYSVKLWKRVDRPRASALFHYSMLYLALLFGAMAVEKVVRGA
jgi:protoheme IX farnesyltransferase